jgi:hypothetical protein
LASVGQLTGLAGDVVRAPGIDLENVSTALGHPDTVQGELFRTRTLASCSSRDTRRMSFMDFEFEGPVIEWRGPSPYYFVRIPEEESADIKFAAKGIEYWGQVPVLVRIGDTEFTTALFPKDGRYLIPLKDAVRKAAALEVDQMLDVALSVGRQ